MRGRRNRSSMTAGASQIIITDLGLIPGGTFSSGLAINNQPIIVGLANDSTFALQRPFWDANTGVIIGFADNFNPASTAIPEHINEQQRRWPAPRFMAIMFTRASIGIPPARHSCCHRWPVFDPDLRITSHQGPRHQQSGPARGYG